MNILKSYNMYEDSGFYLNELTIELDKHLTETYQELHKNEDIYNTYSTYIMKFRKPLIWSIRKFGATRGHIKINKNNIIQEIKISEGIGYVDGISNMSCYFKDVLFCLDKYIGWKLEINEEVFEDKKNI